MSDFRTQLHGNTCASSLVTAMTGIAEFHQKSLSNRDSFWSAEASAIYWKTPFSSTLDFSNPPFTRWFVGGLTNICHNAIDRHLPTRRDQRALIYISTETGVTSEYTYGQLH